MKAERMRGMDAAELQRNSLDAQEQLFRLRFQMGMGSTEGLKKYRNLRKDRARMLTILSEKAKNGETAPVPVVAAPAKKGLLKAKPAAADKKKKK